MMIKKTGLITIGCLVCGLALADVTKELPYPSGELVGEDIIKQTYYVNHFYGFKNMAITKKKQRKI